MDIKPGDKVLVEVYVQSMMEDKEGKHYLVSATDGRFSTVIKVKEYQVKGEANDS